MPAGISDANWTPVRNGIYFIHCPENECSIYFFEFRTRRVHKVSELKDIVAPQIGTTISPDGRTILFTGLGPGEGDIMLVEGFH